MAPVPPSKGQLWKENDKVFIKVLQEYVLKNSLVRRKKGSKQNCAWREISTRLNYPEGYCRGKWQNIKHNYLILKKMIINGRVTEDKVRKNIKTAKYLDGTLDFLDRYIFEIHDSEITLAAHRFFESVFGSSENLDVGAEKLIKIQDNSVIVIKDYKQEAGLEPTSILPNIENYDNDSDIGNTEDAIVGLEKDQTVSEVYQINDDSTDVEFVNSDVLPNIQIKKIDNLYEVQNFEMKIEDPIGRMETNFTSGDHLKEILLAKKQEKTIPSETDLEDGSLYQFLVKYQNSTIEKEKDCDLKEYMKDLAEVACNRLEPGTGKRKYFLSKVDLIVSEILEGT